MTSPIKGLSYHVDIVFCIDVSHSMRSRIGVLRDFVSSMPKDLIEKHLSKDKVIDKCRVRFVMFADCKTSKHSLSATPFFQVHHHRQHSQFEMFLSKLTTIENQRSIHRSGLEALAIAMASDWIQEGDRQRHFIVMLTDASAHRLEDRVGDLPETFTAQIPSSLSELTDIWEGEGQNASGVTTTLKQPARRLFLFVPDMYPWPSIGDNWGQTVFLPSKAGEGLAEVVLELLTNSV